MKKEFDPNQNELMDDHFRTLSKDILKGIEEENESDDIEESNLDSLERDSVVSK